MKEEVKSKNKMIQKLNVNSEIFFVNERFGDEEENIFFELLNLKNEKKSLLINQSKYSYFKFSEGKFVYMRNEYFSKAGANSDVRSLVAKDVHNRRYILNNYTEPKTDSIIDTDGIWSYHINVGCANFSIIVCLESGKHHIWVIDASLRETRTWINYQRNVEECLKYIINKFNLSKSNIWECIINCVSKTPAV